MRVTHTFQAHGTCPVDGSEDEYTVIVNISHREGALPLSVEKLLHLSSELIAGGPTYQEDYTEGLRRAVATQFSTHADAKVSVTTFGSHGASKQVRTECRCE